MCSFCREYGRDKISDVPQLKEAIFKVSEMLAASKVPNEHALQLIDVWMDGDTEPDHDTEAAWESTKARRQN